MFSVVYQNIHCQHVIYQNIMDLAMHAAMHQCPASHAQKHTCVMRCMQFLHIAQLHTAETTHSVTHTKGYQVVTNYQAQIK